VSLRAGRRTILKLRIPARLLGRDRVLAVTIKLKARASGGSSASGRRTLRVRA
jgi:hypothetical protein